MIGNPLLVHSLVLNARPLVNRHTLPNASQFQPVGRLQVRCSRSTGCVYRETTISGLRIACQSMEASQSFLQLCVSGQQASRELHGTLRGAVALNQRVSWRKVVVPVGKGLGGLNPTRRCRVRPGSIAISIGPLPRPHLTSVGKVLIRYGMGQRELLQVRGQGKLIVEHFCCRPTLIEEQKGCAYVRIGSERTWGKARNHEQATGFK